MSRESRLVELAQAVAQAINTRPVYVPATASAISYDSTASGLTGTNVKLALDELAVLAAVQSVNGKTGSVSLSAADVGADAAGTASSAITSHVTASNPHPQYVTSSQAAAAAPVQSVAGRTGVVTLTYADLTGTVPTWNQNTTGNAATATKLATARTIGGVSFDGTANINLPGVNATGNQNTTGSAAKLTTARTVTIGSTGKTFDGSANVAWTVAEIGAAPASHVGSGDTAHAAATTSTAGFMSAGDKAKLNGIASGATVGADWSVNLSNIPANITSWAGISPSTKASADALSALSSTVTSQGTSITSLSAGLAGATTAGGNFITNPTFDPSMNQMDFTVVDSTSTDVPANCPFPYVAVLASRDHLPSMSSFMNLPVSAGDVIECSVLVAVKAGGTASFNMYLHGRTTLTGTGGVASQIVPGSTTTAENGATWVRATGKFTVPAGAAYSFVRPFLQVNQSSPYKTVWYATDWRVRNITAAANAQATAAANATAITALSSSITSLSNEITTARNGAANLDARLDGIDTTVASKANLSSPSFRGTPEVSDGFLRVGPSSGQYCTFDYVGRISNNGGTSYTLWHAGNFDPATKANLSGDNTYDGQARFVGSGEGKLYLRNSTATKGYYISAGPNNSLYFYDDGTPGVIYSYLNSTHSFSGALTTTGNILGANLIAGGSGNGAYVQVGDDAKLIDVGVSHTVGIQSTTNANVGYIRFGGMSGYFGWDGSRLRTNGIFSVISPNGAYFEVTDGGSNYVRYGWNADMSVNGSGWAKIHNDNSASITVANANGASISGNGGGLQFNGNFYIYSRPNVVNATANAWVTMPRIFVQAGDPGNAASDGDLWIW